MTDALTPLPRRGIPPADDAVTTRSTGRRFAEPPPEDHEYFAVPPAPVLPTSSITPGRRFSADDLPDDWTPPPPRRSATSPSDIDRPSPVSPVSPASPPPAAGDEEENVLLDAGHRPPWVWALIAAALLLALAAGWVLQAKPQLAKPAMSAETVQTTLAEPTELAALAPASTWTGTTALAPDEARGLRCIGLGIELRPSSPVPGTTVRRTFTTSGPATVVQQVEAYADEAAARQGYAARLAQLGGCPATPDRVVSGHPVTGLGDEASAVLVREQTSAQLGHHLLVARGGRFVTIVDAQAPESPPALAPLASALQASLGRQCQASGGTCTGTPAVGAATEPPAGVPAGFLTPGDLPRVTPGSGVWIGARIQPMTLAGSECEGLDLTSVPKATSAAQQAFVLKQDPNASPNFGLDEVLYTFASDADATAFATTLTTNLNDCAKRRPAATVTPLGKLAAPAVGQLFTVDLRTTLDKVARSRVLVGVQGTRVVYLAANPTAQFDLSDAAWLDVLQRAVSRAKQQG